MVRGALSDDHMIQLKVVTGTLNSQRYMYHDQILESGVRQPLYSLDGQNMVPRDNIAEPHFTRIIEEYKNQSNIAILLCRTKSSTCGTSSAEEFETGNQLYQSLCEFC